MYAHYFQVQRAKPSGIFTDSRIQILIFFAFLISFSINLYHLLPDAAGSNQQSQPPKSFFISKSTSTSTNSQSILDTLYSSYLNVDDFLFFFIQKFKYG